MREKYTVTLVSKHKEHNNIIHIDSLDNLFSLIISDKGVDLYSITQIIVDITPRCEVVDLPVEKFIPDFNISGQGVISVSSDDVVKTEESKRQVSALKRMVAEKHIPSTPRK